MRNKIIIQAVIFVSAACIFLCCRHEPPPAPVVNCNLKDRINFSADIIPIFNSYCNESGCHSGTHPAGSLNLIPDSAYKSLYSQGQIDTLNPTASVLYISMNSINPAMPPSGRLDSCTIQSVVKWMAQGGKNN